MTAGANADGVTMQSMRDVVRRVRANLNASKAQIGEAEAALKLARATVDRQKKLEEKGDKKNFYTY